MKPNEFCYWLQGYFELRMTESPSEQIVTNDQAMMIQEHLALVFENKINNSIKYEINPTDLDCYIDSYVPYSC